eukprot:SAG25_NODE_14232_length_257_cov_0.974684_1_plen_70_part_01
MRWSFGSTLPEIATRFCETTHFGFVVVEAAAYYLWNYCLLRAAGVRVYECTAGGTGAETDGSCRVLDHRS